MPGRRIRNDPVRLRQRDSFVEVLSANRGNVKRRPGTAISKPVSTLIRFPSRFVHVERPTLSPVKETQSFVANGGTYPAGYHASPPFRLDVGVSGNRGITRGEILVAVVAAPIVEARVEGVALSLV